LGHKSASSTLIYLRETECAKSDAAALSCVEELAS
jgi:hypothetical protein